jgi:hypothetical protein
MTRFRGVDDAQASVGEAHALLIIHPCPLAIGSSVCHERAHHIETALKIRDAVPIERNDSGYAAHDFLITDVD